MENPNEVVNSDVTDQPADEGLDNTQTPETDAPEDAQQPVQPGDKTDPNLLLKSLHEERARRKELEEQVKTLTSSNDPDPEIFSDEGKAIVEKVVAPLQQTVNNLTENLALRDVEAAYPQIKDHLTEFNEYREGYKGVDLANVAKLFLNEKGLLGTTRRKGLEPATGGTRTPQKSGYTPEEIADLRKNNWRKYQKLVENGDIKIEG